MVKSTGVIVVTLLCATNATAQDTSRTDSVQGSAADAARAHTQVVRFENVLRGAVRDGADKMKTQVSRLLPDADMMLAGQTEVTGYRLPPYGAFFTVRVPALTPTYSTWVRVLGQQQARQRTPKQSDGTVRPTSVSARPPEIAAGTPPPPSAPFVDAAVASDPDGVYTREVQNALIEAMLENSQALRIGADEYLTIAARDSAPGDPLASQSDFHTLMFTIKGSDLAAYHGNKISREEAGKRVKITED